MFCKLFNRNLILKTGFVFLVIFLTYSGSVLQAEEEGKTQVEKVNNAWTENLRLRDFHLLPSYVELTKRNKLEAYKNTLYKNYQEHPAVFSTAVEYGLILIDLGELDKAQAVWDKAISDFVGNPTPKVYKAWVDACRGDYLSAKNVWYQVAKEKLDSGITATLWLPDHVDAVLGLYLIKDYLTGKDKEEAEQVAEEIPKHFLNNPKFAAILISEDLRNGDLKPASEKIANILSRNPDDSLSITLLGIAQLISGRHKEALELFEAAEKINPRSPTISLMKARTLLALNKEKESIKFLDKAIKLDPNLNLLKEEKITKKAKLLALRAPYYYPLLKKEEKRTELKENKELKSSRM